MPGGKRAALAPGLPMGVSAPGMRRGSRRRVAGSAGLLPLRRSGCPGSGPVQTPVLHYRSRRSPRRRDGAGPARRKRRRGAAGDPARPLVTAGARLGPARLGSARWGTWGTWGGGTAARGALPARSLDCRLCPLPGPRAARCVPVSLSPTWCPTLTPTPVLALVPTSCRQPRPLPTVPSPDSHCPQP